MRIALTGSSPIREPFLQQSELPTAVAPPPPSARAAPDATNGPSELRPPCVAALRLGGPRLPKREDHHGEETEDVAQKGAESQVVEDDASKRSMEITSNPWNMHLLWDPSMKLPGKMAHGPVMRQGSPRFFVPIRNPASIQSSKHFCR